MPITLIKKAKPEAPAKDELVAGALSAELPKVKLIPKATPKPTPPVKELRVATSIEDLWENRGTTKAPDPTPCKLCGHEYAFPCHGEQHNCMQRQYHYARLAREEKEAKERQLGIR